MGMVCSTHEETVSVYTVLVINPRKELEVDGRIIGAGCENMDRIRLVKENV